jgi:hypothetical protein
MTNESKELSPSPKPQPESGLEVAQPGLESVRYSNPAPPPSDVVWAHIQDPKASYQPYNYYANPSENEERRSQPLICGLQRKVFWLAFVIALILLGGSLAGGIAGGLSANNKKSAVVSTP